MEGTSHFVRRNTVHARHQHQTSTQPHRSYSCRHIASTLAAVLTLGDVPCTLVPGPQHASTGRKYVTRVGGAVRGAGRPGRGLEDARRGRGGGGGGPRPGPTVGADLGPLPGPQHASTGRKYVAHGTYRTVPSDAAGANCKNMFAIGMRRVVVLSLMLQPKSKRLHVCQL